MTENPWNDIPRPQGHGDLCTRRVDPDLPWGFFWGRGPDNSLLFILQHDGPEIGREDIPSLRGVEILDKPNTTGEGRLLILRLESTENRDIFAHLCRDIVTVAGTAKKQKSAVDRTLKRTWRWHHFLRSGASKRLSKEHQKGLMAEVLFLQETAAPVIGLAAAVRAWQGPYGCPKDFEFGATCVEIKSKRAAGSGKVKISSPEQLDTSGIKNLFLHVRDIDDVELETTGSCTLDQVIGALVSDCETNAPAVIMELETTLLAAGYTIEEDYSQDTWKPGAINEYRVDDAFPRIIPSEIPAEVGYVSYTVDMHQCGAFKAAADEIAKMLGGDK